MLIAKNIFTGHLMKEQSIKLEFKIAVTDPIQSHFSLKKEGADFSYNQIVLNTVIGTLVKYGQSGRIEPYLAESWTVSNDNKTWIFKFRNGLFAENGEAINAPSFFNILKTNLKIYSKSGSVIVFDHLLGWQDFTSGKSDSLKGLTLIENSIKFDFDSPPDSFLELLRMPYFGFWLGEDNLISTGPYKLKSIKQNEIILALRDNWFTTSTESAKEVIISFTDFNSVNLNKSKNTITRLPFFVEAGPHNDVGYWIMSPPTRLESFTLSPLKKNFFNNLQNRRIFNKKIRSQFPEIVKADFFYQSARSKITNNNTTEKYQDFSNVSPLTFALERTNYSKEELETLDRIITSALSGTSVKFKIISRDLNDKDWFKKTDSNDFFDARISSVDIGASPLYTAIKMMFCTKLGINFPDPSGKICDLVSKGISSSQEINQDFINEFNQILYDDSVVIPIQHHSDKWFVTNDIDPKSMPPTTLYPQFELIRTR
jgi:MarR-like DNA-binding transcriptional regulator SgrR of sgrS sRNA